MREARAWRVPAADGEVAGLEVGAASPDAPPTPARVARHLALSAASARHDATSVLSRVTGPALVLAGGRDEVVAVERSRALAEALPAAAFEVFVDLGHGFPEQAREPFQARVLRFLAALGVGRHQPVGSLPWIIS